MRQARCRALGRQQRGVDRQNTKYVANVGKLCFIGPRAEAHYYLVPAGGASQPAKETQGLATDLSRLRYSGKQEPTPSHLL